jgi:hypothetical protein
MTDIEVDFMAAARRVLASPEGAYTLTPHEAVALAACTVRESTGEMPELPRVIEAGPVLSASLAAAVAVAIRGFDLLRLAEGVAEKSPARERAAAELDDARAAFDGAFNTLKTSFEKEFPNGRA